MNILEVMQDAEDDYKTVGTQPISELTWPGWLRAGETMRAAREAAAELIAAVADLRECEGYERADVGSVAERRLDVAKARVDAALKAVRP